MERNYTICESIQKWYMKMVNKLKNQRRRILNVNKEICKYRQMLNSYSTVTDLAKFLG